MNLSRRLALIVLAGLAMALDVASVPAAGLDAESAVEYLQRTYHLKITVQTTDGLSGNVRLGGMTNPAQVDDYLRALADECKKYPAGFFSRVGLSEIVLSGDLRMADAPINGAFDYQKKKLYMRFHWCKYGANCRQLFHAFHHELGHAVQTAVWGDGHYDWREWTALNPSGFHYGKGGGQELMANPGKNWAAWSSDQPGFLNSYSATAPWEDRSEIMAALMNDGDRNRLPPYCRRDAILQKKLELMAGLLSKLCGPSPPKYFWEQAVSSLKAQTEGLSQVQCPNLRTD